MRKLLRKPWVVMLIIWSIAGIACVIRPDLWGPALMLVIMTGWINFFVWGLGKVSSIP